MNAAENTHEMLLSESPRLPSTYSCQEMHFPKLGNFQTFPKRMKHHNYKTQNKGWALKEQVLYLLELRFVCPTTKVAS